MASTRPSLKKAVGSFLEALPASLVLLAAFRGPSMALESEAGGSCSSKLMLPGEPATVDLVGVDGSFGE